MNQPTVRLVSRVVLVSAVLWAVAGAAPALGQVDTDTDSDGDGVMDSVDQCPDTDAGDLVDATGCSVCPCDGGDQPWDSHEAYVACVTKEVRARKAAHEMKRSDMRAEIRRARKATCGNDNLTRCCVYAHIDDNLDVNIGQCRVVTVDACDALSQRDDLDWVEDVDAGSCTPNPCQY